MQRSIGHFPTILCFYVIILLQNTSVLLQKTCQSRVRRIWIFQRRPPRGTEGDAVELIQVIFALESLTVSTTARLGYERSSEYVSASSKDWFQQPEAVQLKYAAIFASIFDRLGC